MYYTLHRDKQIKKMKIKKEWRKKMYKNYIFDLYGTLVDIRTDEGKNSLWKKMSE